MASETSRARTSEEMGKHAYDRQGYENSRHEYQSVDNGSGDELPGTRTTSKHIKPTDCHDRQTNHAHEAFLMPNKSGVPEDGLGDAGPNNQQEADQPSR